MPHRLYVLVLQTHFTIPIRVVWIVKQLLKYMEMVVT